MRVLRIICWLLFLVVAIHSASSVRQAFAQCLDCSCGCGDSCNGMGECTIVHDPTGENNSVCYGAGCYYGSDSNYSSDSNYPPPSLACGATCYTSPWESSLYGSCASDATCVVTSGRTGKCQLTACSASGAQCNYNQCQQLTAPTGLQVAQRVGGTTIHTNDIRLSWSAPTSTAWSAYFTCVDGLGIFCTRRYTLTISSTSDFSSDIYQETLTRLRLEWNSQGITEALNLLKDNKQYYAKLCAEYERTPGGAWRSLCTSPVSFTKVPYPTGEVSGSIQKRARDGATYACSEDVPTSSIGTIQLLPNTGGYSTNCTQTASGSATIGYNCTITLDNVNSAPAPSNYFSLSLSGALATYACRGTCSVPGSCSNVLLAQFDTNSPTTTSASVPIYVDYVSSSFYKVRNMSVYTKGPIDNPFPVGHLPFDAINDQVGNNFFVQGDSPTNFDGVGVIMSNGTQRAGLLSAPYAGLSGKGWSNTSYNTNTTHIPLIGTNYIDYVLTKKQYISIASLDDSTLSGASYGIFLYSGDLTLDSTALAKLANKHIVLMTKGTITIANNVSTGGSLGLFANQIYVNDSVSSVRALLSANAVQLKSQSSTTTNSSTPLLINGTINSIGPVKLTDRERTDTSLRPATLILFDVDAYLRLLPYVHSTRTQYTQVQ